MVRSNRLVALGAALLHSTSLFVAAADEFRLVKTSDEDAGTWMTEEQKWDLTAQGIRFIDITDTIELEDEYLARLNTSLETRELSRRAIPSSPSHQSEAAPLVAAATQTNMKTWANAMVAYRNRHYKGSYATQAATWMFNTVKSVASANTAITVSQFTHSSYDQPSVIAKIPGTGSGVVVVSAHYDSTGGSTTSVGPGADDNASGVVVILEALRVLAAAKYKGPNTLEFHFYSGEEGGLLGSRDVMQSYKRAGTDIRAVLNQDMTGYSPNNVIAVYTDYVDATLTSFCQKLVPVYTSLKLVTDRCGYGCSDHASANTAGYRAAYVCEDTMADSSPYIHSSRDTISTLSFPHMLEHAKYTIGFLVEGAYF
ncbi:leucyl aminopeptidase [Microdochium trichocladiopsis]|uniref:Peptide hydrolase n=1 Tax=Microdochium trichocladiopsis TaxID=1682393 RepID=A0A9P9BV04_9PEZI|nr:leucyl aminopeptidase [Microdochium trichocladiopsis]KAH7038156.1 leucyl aminopeptidase [Microdochium trichocladiopsis]